MLPFDPTLPTHPDSRPFLFATGIENSYPTIIGRDGVRIRRDEMAECGHYERWREDFKLVQDMGITHLRYGPPYHSTHLGPGRYDWNFSDETLGELRRLHIAPIVDLCHFGVPDWIGNFQNPEWPQHFADYALAFAQRYPWVRYYTPVNEIFITALFSGEYGWWNECMRSEQGFVVALKHLVQANLLAERAILGVTPAALFIQSESTEYFHAAHPEAAERAGYLNQKRFLSLDLCYGHDVRARMYQYLTDNGMTREEYDWVMREGTAIKPHCIMGNDYYITNEHLVPRGVGNLSECGDVFGYYVITKQYFDRYRLPVMHSETNYPTAEGAVEWLWKQWANMVRLKQDGVPIIGFTWYSLTDQVDWDTALREYRGTVNPRGLYDLNRQIRPVGREYRKLVQQWRNILPLGSFCLTSNEAMEPAEISAIS